MPSSNSSPGPHDRRGFGVTPRKTCIFIRRNGQKCKRFTTSGATKLCAFHAETAEAEITANETGTPMPPQDNVSRLNRAQIAAAARRDPNHPLHGGPQPTKGDVQKSAIHTSMSKKNRNLTAWVMDRQAREALNKLKLGEAVDDVRTDPKAVLLDSVTSAWRQRQVWEAMLAAIPDEDFQHIGEPPLPGSVMGSKGARIEVIQKMLSEATKVSARTSKLAIDAGIEERLVRLAEDQANLIADTVRAGLLVALTALVRELRLDPAVEAKITELALQTAAGHLRVLATGQPVEVIDGAAVELSRKPSSRPINKRKEFAADS